MPYYARVKICTVQEKVPQESLEQGYLATVRMSKVPFYVPSPCLKTIVEKLTINCFKVRVPQIRPQ